MNHFIQQEKLSLMFALGLKGLNYQLNMPK